MDARKGETFFHPNPRHTSFNLPSNEKNKTLRRQQRARKGGDIFSQKTKFPRIASLTNKSYIETTLLQNIPPGNDSLGRGETFFKNYPNERRLGQQQITSRRKSPATNQRRRYSKGANLHKDPSGRKKNKGRGRRFSPRAPRQSYHRTSNDAQNTAPRRVHITKHLEGCTKHTTSKDAHNKAPRRMHKTQHLEGCT